MNFSTNMNFILFHVSDFIQESISNHKNDYTNCVAYVPGQIWVTWVREIYDCTVLRYNRVTYRDFSTIFFEFSPLFIPFSF